ncbi:YbcC family protein [Rhodoflexus sp.]
MDSVAVFDEVHTLHKLKHYLPSQGPLKDFIHHNTLHAFQHQKFHQALHQASEIFGYQTYLPLEEYRHLHKSGEIRDAVIRRVIIRNKGEAQLAYWREKMHRTLEDITFQQRIGQLRRYWKELYKLNLEKEINPLLFRVIAAYLDQGIALQKFPVSRHGFLASLRQLERNNFTSIFRKPTARRLLLHTDCALPELLKLIVGDERYYEQYLFDQQFAHPGWSGMVAVLEEKPDSLFDRRAITLRDFIAFELLLEIDALENKLGKNWQPFSQAVKLPQVDLFAPPASNEYFEVCALWQEAMEWSYYDQVLRGMQLTQVNGVHHATEISLQAIFCIDDRECSIRRHIERLDPHAQTFGTAGFFNIEFLFQPEHSKFTTKSCPAPMQPRHIIREREARKRHSKDAHLSRRSRGFWAGLIVAPALGLAAAARLAWSIFKPIETSTMVSSFNHMDKNGTLDIHCKDAKRSAHGYQFGFTTEEMADRIEGLLRSIGLIENFAPLVYIIGHGASSVNNTHYAGYDCGACSGRAGSVNARAAATMANMPEVRALLAARGIHIPDSTHFVGGLHDTTRDLADFFDEHLLPESLKQLHQEYKALIDKALSLNAKERSRRFLLIDSEENVEKVHKQVQKRALSLFEPRPEWNHATNALCIVGRRASNKHLFLDRRAFLNSYDYATDPEGKYLLGILKAVAPVCGGINLEYYFSRVDNERLGAGSKLPHNVVGLIGVANGLEGDLRTGLPRQMINIHQPLRLMVIVEHVPEIVLQTIRQHAPTYDWFANEWVHLAVVHPQSKEIYYFENEEFKPYQPLLNTLEIRTNLMPEFETVHDNLPVYLMQ